jgi:sugar transferase (PEP-CTERM/EpsH1 system associated)
VCHASNGVDVAYFAPTHGFANPYSGAEEAIVFTGAMDYWPNIDAATWFVHDILPSVLAARPRARFYIVGMRPTPTIQALAQKPQVVVTGAVPDIRPYLHHASVVVAPLRVARGIQNKVLEAMAMARPVVVSAGAAEGLSGEPGVDFETAANAQDFARKTIELMDGRLADAIGVAARQRVVADYAWTVNLAPFATILDNSAPAPASVG